MGSRLELGSFCNVPMIQPYVVGGCTTTLEARELMKETFADFLITDDCPEAGSGIALAKEFRHVKTLVLTYRENAELVREAEEAGVDGLVFRSAIGLSGEGSFLMAMERIAKGGVWLSPAVTCIVGNADTDALALVGLLTQSERKVLALLSKGLDNQEIANDPSVMTSLETTKSHLRGIREKFGPDYSDRVRLALLGLRAGLT